MKAFLRSYPGWFALQVVELGVLLAIAKLLLAAGAGQGPTLVVVLGLALGLVAFNYNVRRRYLSDDDR